MPSVETICLLMLQPRKKCVETICLLMLQPRSFTQIAEKIITEIPVFMENFKFWEAKFVCVQGLSQFIMYVVEHMIGSKLLICC